MQGFIHCLIQTKTATICKSPNAMLRLVETPWSFEKDVYFIALEFRFFVLASYQRIRPPEIDPRNEKSANA